jgi:hypothetical protein
MKNSKLLLTSALVGTVAMGAVANAETKISGSATYTYGFVNGTTLAGNTQGAGKEVQLDISNSSTLENGLGFSAGFSMEHDGGQASADFSEGNFMKFSSGNTSVMWNIDKAANLSRSATPRVSTSINTMMAGIAASGGGVSGQSSATMAYDYAPGGQQQQSSWNLELAQKFDGGTAYLVYVPRVGDSGGANDAAGNGTISGTATDFILTGNLGVDGLNALVAISKTDAVSSATQDSEVQQLGLAYNFGKIAVGVTQATIDQSDNTEDTQREYGVTYAVSDNLSVGLLHANTDNNGTGNEKINALQVGYNLGAVSVEAYAIEVQNLNGVATAANQEKIGIRLGTKF